MRYPGFKYDGKTKRAWLEWIVPGTGKRKRHRKTPTDVTRDEALAEWKKFRAPRPEPEPDSEPWTFGRYVEEHSKATAARVKAQTAKNEEYQLRKWLLPRFGEVPLERINAAGPRDLATDLEASGLSAWTVNNITALLIRI